MHFGTVKTKETLGKTALFIYINFDLTGAPIHVRNLHVYDNYFERRFPVIASNESTVTINIPIKSAHALEKAHKSYVIALSGV